MYYDITKFMNSVLETKELIPVLEKATKGAKDKQEANGDTSVFCSNIVVVHEGQVYCVMFAKIESSTVVTVVAEN
jgi:hypothetical protein